MQSMQLTTERSEFARGVALVARGLMNSPPHPVLAGVKLTATTGDTGTLTISGFDYERSTVLTLSATVESPGEAIVPGRLLANITKTLPNKPVSITLDADQAAINCGSAHYTLNTLPTGEYPGLPKLPEETGTINGAALAAAVAAVAPAAATEETLAQLTAVRIETNQDYLTLSATDRYRIAVRRLPWKCATTPQTTEINLPATTLHDLAKAIATTEIVRLHLPTTDSQVGITADPMAVTMRQLEQGPPDYRILWPKPDAIKGTIRVRRTALIDAIRRAALVLNRGQALALDCTDTRITLSAGSAGDARARDHVDATVTGNVRTIAFNPDFLSSALTAFDTDEIEIHLQHPHKPALVLPPDAGDDPDLQYLLMPIRLR